MYEYGALKPVKVILRKGMGAGYQWLTPVILATQEAEIRIEIWSQPGQIVHETLSRKYVTQKELVEWLKMKALSSSPGTTKKKKEGRSGGRGRIMEG
jgi:hypothetical protein